MRRFASFFLVLLLASLACSADFETPQPLPPTEADAPPTTAPDAADGPIPMQVGYGYRGPFYEIYFTDPFNPEAFREEGGPDIPLAKAIEAARLSVDVAVYSFSLDSIRNALLNAHERGVKVRVVMETDNMDRAVPQELMGAGIEIVGDQREGLMHNKFVIIDRSEVWMGSTNFTTSGVYEDNNNLVRIRSVQMAENYLTEFEEMFTDDFFGPDVVSVTPNPVLTIDGINLETYFSPDDGVARRIVELLRSARQSIYFMAYSFTADDFGDILLQKAKDGLDVAGVMEEEQVKSNTGTEYERFLRADLNVFLDGNAGQMHHKVFIIDESIVIAGSYNFSASAERKNDENVVIFFDPVIAAQYLAEFERVYGQAQK